MQISNPYSPRPIRFREVYRHVDWNVKIYSISHARETVAESDVLLAKSCLDEWLRRSDDYPLACYKFATLILHEYNGGLFAVINWWVDENMLQNFVYLKTHGEAAFRLYSDNGLATCVWEMAVWWHERNAWVNHILKQSAQPDWEGYLKDQLNIDL